MLLDDDFFSCCHAVTLLKSQHWGLETCLFFYFFTQNCCVMSLTLLDEFKKPFWCASSPIFMTLEKTPVSYDYDGEHFLIHYQDSDGQVKLKLVLMKEQKQFVLISLVVYVTVCKVNEHFTRDYWRCSISGTRFEIYNHYSSILWLCFLIFWFNVSYTVYMLSSVNVVLY